MEGVVLTVGSDVLAGRFDEEVEDKMLEGKELTSLVGVGLSPPRVPDGFLPRAM